MHNHTTQNGFSLIELLITLAIVAILTVAGTASYHYLFTHSYRQAAEQNLLHAASLYRYRQLQSSPGQPIDTQNLFQPNGHYRFNIKKTATSIQFIAQIKSQTSHDQSCTSLLLDLHGNTSAQNQDGTTNKHCWST